MFPSISSIFFSARKHLVVTVFFMFVLFLGLLGGCGSYLFIRRVPDISHTPRIISSLVEIPQNGIQHGSFREVAPTCPNLSCFPLFLPSSFQQEAFGRDCFFHVLSCFCAGWVVGAIFFYSRGIGHLTYPWNNFFPGRNPIEWHSTDSTWLLPGSGPSMSQPFMFPSISSIFSSARKHLVVIVLSCFVLFLCWLGGCGSYFFIRRVPDISHTPRIISSLVEIPQNGIQHGSFREVAPTCPNLSCFPLFLPSSFQQESIWL